MLTTLQRAKEMLGIEMPDDELTILLSVASQAIEEKCRRNFRKQVYESQADGLRGKYIRLPNYPIHSVSAHHEGRPLKGIEILEDGILFRSCGWPCGERVISLTYTAGYVLPGDATPDEPATLPETLEYACILLVKHLQREPGVTAERVGDISVSYAADQMDMPLAVKSLIAPHIRPDM